IRIRLSRAIRGTVSLGRRFRRDDARERPFRRCDHRATDVRDRLALPRCQSVARTETKIAQAEGSWFRQSAPDLLIRESTARLKIRWRFACRRKRRGHAFRQDANLRDGHERNAHEELEENCKRIVQKQWCRQNYNGAS